MCFSAESSFASGVALVVTGVATLQQTKAPNQYLFASIPLLLAIQQFAEGYLWLIFSGQGDPFWQQMVSYLFLFFAQVIWPFWISFSILILESSRKRKRIIGGILVMGCMVALFLLYRLIAEPVKTEVSGHHISYIIGPSNSLTTSDSLVTISGIFYFLCIIFPPLISSINKMYLFGISIAISYFFSILFFKHYIISVWCFFAAMTSIIVFFILFDLGKRHHENIR